LFVENTQIVHSRLVEQLRPGQSACPGALPAGALQPQHDYRIAVLNAEVTRQAQMVAYIDDFKLMMVIAFLVAPPAVAVAQAARP